MVKTICRNILKYAVLFCIGGAVYCGIELMARSRSHWSMFILGGLCFVYLGLLNEFFIWETPLVQQMLAGSVGITVLEFLTGCYVNLYKGWNVWDYSDMACNYLGQVCYFYSFLWFLLSVVGIMLDDYIRYKYFGEDKPRYRLF